MQSEASGLPLPLSWKWQRRALKPQHDVHPPHPHKKPHERMPPQGTVATLSLSLSLSLSDSLSFFCLPLLHSSPLPSLLLSPLLFSLHATPLLPPLSSPPLQKRQQLRQLTGSRPSGAPAPGLSALWTSDEVGRVQKQRQLQGLRAPVGTFHTRQEDDTFADRAPSRILSALLTHDKNTRVQK